MLTRGRSKQGLVGPRHCCCVIGRCRYCCDAAGLRLTDERACVGVGGLLIAQIFKALQTQQSLGGELAPNGISYSTAIVACWRGKGRQQLWGVSRPVGGR